MSKQIIAVYRTLCEAVGRYGGSMENVNALSTNPHLADQVARRLLGIRDGALFGEQFQAKLSYTARRNAKTVAHKVCEYVELTPGEKTFVVCKIDLRFTLDDFIMQAWSNGFRPALEVELQETKDACPILTAEERIVALGSFVQDPRSDDDGHVAIIGNGKLRRFTTCYPARDRTEQDFYLFLKM